MSRRRGRSQLARATLVALACAGATACHHNAPPAQDATHASAPPVASPSAVGAMPVGSIKEDRGDVRYVNPTMQAPARRDGGTSQP